MKAKVNNLALVRAYLGAKLYMRRGYLPGRRSGRREIAVIPDFLRRAIVDCGPDNFRACLVPKPSGDH